MSRATGIAGAFALVVFSCVAFAQSALPVPAELPPARYGADTFVDSSGCAFARVMVGASTVWAPRYRADGEQLCGEDPSLDPLASLKNLGVVQPGQAGAGDQSANGLEDPGIYIQAGAFGVPANAARVADSFIAEGWGAQARAAGRFIMVYAGPFDDAETAETALRQVRRLGMPDAFLLRQE